MRREYALIFRQLAQNKYYLGDVEARVADWNQAIRLDPKYAIEDYDQVIQLDYKYTKAYKRRNLAYQKLRAERNREWANKKKGNDLSHN